jgi:hypothetical protein
MPELRDENRIDRLEQKVDDGFATVRKEARADFRFLIVGLSALMLSVMILGFAAIIAAGS